MVSRAEKTTAAEISIATTIRRVAALIRRLVWTASLLGDMANCFLRHGRFEGAPGSSALIERSLAPTTSRGDVAGERAHRRTARLRDGWKRAAGILGIHVMAVSFAPALRGRSEPAAALSPERRTEEVT
jgi:hypothetical protein